jgi:hypothetical protein
MREFAMGAGIRLLQAKNFFSKHGHEVLMGQLLLLLVNTRALDPGTATWQQQLQVSEALFSSTAYCCCLCLSINIFV